MGSYKFRARRNTGGMFASTAVLTIAAFGAIFVGMFAFPNQPLILWLVFGGILCFALGLAWLLRDRPVMTLRESLGWLSRKVDDTPQYEPRRVKADRGRFGTQRPPTVDEIRDLKDTDRNWVPSRGPGTRKTPRRK